MKTILFFLAILSFSAIQAQHAQDSTKTKKKGFVETVKDIPDMLIAQPDQGPDSMANKLRNDNLYINVNPIWKDKGTNIGNDLKLQKVNEEPLAETFPLADKKLVNGFVLTLLTQKKTADEKKQAAIAQVKTHLMALYKEAGKSHTAAEVTAQVNSMISGPETFTTTEGKQGELYIIQDIQVEQSNLILLFITPGTRPGTTCTVQYTYYHYNYETDYPNDVMEMRLFQFEEDKTAYIDFTKGMLKTLQVK